MARGHYCQLIGKNLAWKDVLPSPRKGACSQPLRDRPPLPVHPSKSIKKVWMEPGEEAILKARLAAWIEQTVLIAEKDITHGKALGFQLLPKRAHAWLQELKEAKAIEDLEMPTPAYRVSEEEEKKRLAGPWYIVPTASQETVIERMLARVQPHWPRIIRVLFKGRIPAGRLYATLLRPDPFPYWAPLPSSVVSEVVISLLLQEGAITRVPSGCAWYRNDRMEDILAPTALFGKTKSTQILETMMITTGPKERF